MGETMNEAVKLILTLSISGGLVALVLLALKPLMRNRLSKSFQYYIWLVALLRFILPFSFGINLMDFAFNTPGTPQMVEELILPNNNPANINLNPEANDSAVNNYEVTMPEWQPSAPVSTNNEKPFDILKTLADNLMWIWLIGVVISVVCNAYGYLRFMRYVHNTAHVMEMPNSAAKVYKSHFAHTPMLVGLIKPRIYLPDIEYSDEQLNNIMLHELTHLRRYDVWLKWFAALVMSVHWFNPIVYFMQREFNRACELSCDEAVIRNLDSAAKQSYGNTLISVVAESRYPVGVMSVTMCEEKTKLKERLVAIMNYKKKTKITVFITIILTLVITGSAFAFGASTGIKDQNFEMRNEGVTIISQNKDGIHFHIDKIMPNEAICLSKIELKSDVKYTLTLTAESGSIPFAALNESPNITSFHGIAWDQFEMNGSLNSFTKTFSYIDKENYYIYVGSINKTIENVDVVLTSADTNKEMRDEEYSISLTELRRLAAKGDRLLMEDFSNYGGQSIGSGTYILHFKIESGYTLQVGNHGITGKPLYATLSIPGVEENIDIRYKDIDEFISKYPVPNELSAQIYQYLDTIMSSPSLSSATSDYIAAHLNEYAAIWNMGETALPTLTDILNSGDKSLRGNIAALLVQDIIISKSDKPHSDWLDGVLQSASRSIEQWSVDNTATGDNPKEKETKGSSVPISIASIDAGKVVCIGSITINSEYDLIYDVTAEKGAGLFVALSKEEKIISFTGKQWTMYVGNGSTENKVQGINTIPPNLNGTYYLYVGSTDGTLTNIRGTVTQSPKGTVTQYSNSSNKIIDEKNVTVNTSEKSSQKNNDTLNTSLTEVFKLERSFQGAGYFMEGPSFTIQDDITIDVSVSMTADVGKLRFYIKSENGDIIYDVSGDIVSETSRVFLEAGKYQALLEGSNLKGIRYSIKGYPSLNN